ncbi:MAG: ATP-binding protein [Paracoccaceae bacterium]
MTAPTPHSPARNVPFTSLKWRIWFTVCVTVTSIIISLIVYSMITFMLDTRIERVGLILSTLVPMVVAPLASWVSSGLYVKISNLNIDLAKAKARIEQQTARKEAMLRRLSHEVRTPAAVMNTIAHTPHLLAARGDSLRDASDMLLDILDTLRMAIDDGSDLPLTMRKLPLGRLGSDLTFLAEALATDTQTTLTCDMRIAPQHTEAVVSGDTLRLKSAVLNLVRNALLHADASNVRLTLKTAPKASAAGPTGDAGSRLCLTVRVDDDGVGIPRDKAEALFQPHARGATTAPGSGLGLAIARDWVKDMGGHVSYSPSPLGGAGFVIKVPMQIAPAAKHRPARVASHSDQQGRILLVDDDRLSRFINAEILGRHTAHVDTADSCTAARAAVAADHYDMVLTDYQMPDGTGADLVADLRAAGFDGIALGLTASNDSAVRDDYRRAGAQDVLVKPMTLDRVLDHLRAGLAVQASARASARAGLCIASTTAPRESAHAGDDDPETGVTAFRPRARQ